MAKCHLRNVIGGLVSIWPQFWPVFEELKNRLELLHSKNRTEAMIRYPSGREKGERERE